MLAAMSTMNRLRGVVFDAYGTLFDVYSVGTLAETLFPRAGVRLVERWRETQIDYTRVRTLSGQYVPFSQVTREALRYASARCGVDLQPEHETALMHAYDRLQAFPEAQPALERLRALGVPTAILSNGDPAMLAGAVGTAGIGGLLDHVLSVDAVRRYKTALEAYGLAPQAFACAVGELMFVSSNGWDACGATWYGFRTIWINRGQLPSDELGVRPHREGRSLDDAVAFAQELLHDADPAVVHPAPRVADDSSPTFL